MSNEEATLTVWGETLTYRKVSSNDPLGRWGLLVGDYAYVSEHFAVYLFWPFGWYAEICGEVCTSCDSLEDTCAYLRERVALLCDVFQTSSIEEASEGRPEQVVAWAKRKKLPTGQMILPGPYCVVAEGVRSTYSTFTWTGEHFLLGDASEAGDTLPISEVHCSLRRAILSGVISCVLAKCAKVDS